jgi:hypothetical protein
MPFFKTSGKLVYYAHVPKCGGSAVGAYMRQRFGDIAFSDTQYMSQPEARRWTRTSPQHVDAKTMERLIPLSFFDACFTIVRHPVARAISAYHFQAEVEGQVEGSASFSDWLATLPEVMAQQPFAMDNHIRPMTQIVPDGAAVFHLEHGLDPLVAWFDALTGMADGPRMIEERNTRGAHTKTTGKKAEPSAADLDLIVQLYAADFTRFGYDPADRKPKRTAPPTSADFIAARDSALRRQNAPFAQLQQRISRRIRRLLR